MKESLILWKEVPPHADGDRLAYWGRAESGRRYIVERYMESIRVYEHEFYGDSHRHRLIGEGRVKQDTIWDMKDFAESWEKERMQND